MKAAWLKVAGQRVEMDQAGTACKQHVCAGVDWGSKGEEKQWGVGAERQWGPQQPVAACQVVSALDCSVAGSKSQGRMGDSLQALAHSSANQCCLPTGWLLTS